MPMLQQAAGAQPGAQPGVKPPPPGVGAVDVTTPEGQADPNNFAAPSGAAGAVGQLRSGDKGNIMEEKEATPEEQAEYDQALEAMHRILYEDEERTNAVLQMLDPQDKIGSTTKTAIQLLQKMDEKLDMDEAVVAEVTVELADRLIELGERAHGMEFSEKETQAVAGATWEGVMELFGLDANSVKEMTAGMDPKEIDAIEKQYKGYVEGANG